MDFKTYQSGTDRTALYQQQIEALLEPLSACVAQMEDPAQRSDLLIRLAYIGKLLNVCYALLGYGGEVGELLNGFKKVLRGDRGLEDFCDEALYEQGDALWYAAQLSGHLGHNLEDVAQLNLEKLASRQERGVIQGSGDHR